jgi:hypothetical protein
VERIVVQAGPYASLPECYDSLKRALRTVVVRRIEDLASASMGRPMYVPDEIERMGMTDRQIVSEYLADDPYVENGQASFGPTTTVWGLMEFDREDDRRLLEAWRGYARRDGVIITAVGSLGLLSVLGLIYGLIKVDTWTRGYYTKRLFIGVPAAIIALIALLGAIAP